MQKLTVFVLALAAFCLHCEAKQFTRCGLVQELRRQGFPEDKMRDWVCLVENESGRKTDKTGTVNKNGSRDYGLFQINDKYWCSNTSTPGKDCNVTCARVCLIDSESGRRTDVIGGPDKNGSRDYGLFQINDNFWCSNSTTPGKGCRVTCADLITDDITKASICAQKIFRRQGFPAWHGWTKRCQGDLPDISDC